MAAVETLCNNVVIETGNQINVNSVLEVSSNQGILSLALRTLRLSKSNLNSISTDSISGDRKVISLDEVSQHDTAEDCWIILFDRVYDVTDFLYKHPGGCDPIVEYAGRDASQAFRGHSKFALMSLKQYEIGALPFKECIYRRNGLLRYDELPE